MSRWFDPRARRNLILGRDVICPRARRNLKMISIIGSNGHMSLTAD